MNQETCLLKYPEEDDEFEPKCQSSQGLDFPEKLSINFLAIFISILQFVHKEAIEQNK